VVNFIGSDQFAILFTSFTQRVIMDEFVPDPFPDTTVAFPGCWVTIVLLIPSGFLLGVFFTETL